MHKARKRFGQNFLIDSAVISRIISVIAPKKDDIVLEIGPGRGALTLPLLDKLNSLQVLEIDTDLIGFLQSLKKDNLLIHQGDILKFDLSTIPSPIRVVGNLPYNISSPILLHLLKHKDCIQDMVFMLQREVVERIVSQNGNKNYGRLSVIMQAFFEMQLVFTVPPSAFIPMPRVNSAIIYIKPLAKPLIEEDKIEAFKMIVKMAFAQRRKTLKNCLKSIITQQQTSIDLTQRAEMLSVNNFIVLMDDYENRN